MMTYGMFLICETFAMTWCFGISAIQLRRFLFAEAGPRQTGEPFFMSR